MKINANFDSGNIAVENITGNHADLNIPNDTHCEFKQWFHFHVHASVGETLSFSLLNAGDCSYVEGWENYQAVASYNGDDWFRVETEFVDSVVTFKHKLQFSSIYFAYFAPYSYQRHQQLIHNTQLEPMCSHQVLGDTVEGRNIDLLVIGEEAQDKKPIWMIARQHPGESMAEWCAEGVIQSLLDEDNATSQTLLKDYVFYIVPNMNPDGAIAGNLRSNAAGENLNREWLEPTIEKSPEVYYVRQKILETGADAFIDIHGDEAIPYVFIAASEGVPSYNDKMAKLESDFLTHLTAVNPDFQTQYGYPKDEPGKGNLSMASSWVGEQFGGLAVTLEMPFKDNDNLPNAETGWSPERSYLLGASLLNALHMTLN